MDIPGSELLTRLFGRWPSFHDAEVVRLTLERTEPHADGPDLIAEVHAFEMTDRIGPDGRYVLRHHVLVTFRFRGVDSVNLKWFNNQNVLAGLAISDIRSRLLEDLKYEVRFDGSFGVDASFLCRDVRVETVRPWQ